MKVRLAHIDQHFFQKLHTADLGTSIYSNPVKSVKQLPEYISRSYRKDVPLPQFFQIPCPFAAEIETATDHNKTRHGKPVDPMIKIGHLPYCTVHRHIPEMLRSRMDPKDSHAGCNPKELYPYNPFFLHINKPCSCPLRPEKPVYSSLPHPCIEILSPPVPMPYGE